MNIRVGVLRVFFQAALAFGFVAALMVSGGGDISDRTHAAPADSNSQCPNLTKGIKKYKDKITKQLDLRIKCTSEGDAVDWPRLGKITEFEITPGETTPQGIYRNNIVVNPGDRSRGGTAIGYDISEFCFEVNLGVAFPNPDKSLTQLSLRLIQRGADTYTLRSAPGTGAARETNFRCTNETE